ncbi:MAG: hypothetical protein K6U88_17120 [Dehalococcoidia bacterium]|nr:hypothetical protein [Dehalococcoidia bacterium]
MSFFGKLLGQLGRARRQEQEAGEAACPHMMLGQRWDSVADMGREDKVTEYRCQSCGQRFTPEEGRALRDRNTANPSSTGA